MMHIEYGHDTNSEIHRRECEARLVMTWDKEHRQDHYISVETKRGRAAMLELFDETKRQWKLANG